MKISLQVKPVLIGLIFLCLFSTEILFSQDDIDFQENEVLEVGIIPAIESEVVITEINEEKENEEEPGEIKVQTEENEEFPKEKMPTEAKHSVSEEKLRDDISLEILEDSVQESELEQTVVIDVKNSTETLNESQKWSLILSASYSRNIDYLSTRERFSYSPSLLRKDNDLSSWGFGISIGHDFYFDEGISVDNIFLSHQFSYDKNKRTEVRKKLSVNIIEIQRNDSEGYRILNRLNFLQNLLDFEGVSFDLSITPFFLFAEYEESLNGEEYTIFGSSESVSLSKSYGDIGINLVVGLQQGYRAGSLIYSNSNSQIISYTYQKNLSIGFTHSLSTLVMDSNTNAVMPNILLGDQELSNFTLSLSYID